MRLLLLLLLLSITNVYAQEKVLGVDIPKDFIVEYNEWDNGYSIFSSNMEEIQEKDVLEDNDIVGTIAVIGDTNLGLLIANAFWEDPEYQNKSGEKSKAMFYIKNNGKILKKEFSIFLTGESGFSTLIIGENLLYGELSFIIDNLNENSTLRIKDFAGNVFEYEGKELKPLVDTINLYKQLKKAI